MLKATITTFQIILFLLTVTTLDAQIPKTPPTQGILSKINSY